MIPNFKFFFNNKSETLDIVLHGGSQGMDSSLIDKIVDTSKSIGNSIVAFNFHFFERGDDKSSGPELIEEQDTLQAVLDYCKSKDFHHVRLIGKSLGGVIASYYLKRLTPEEMAKFSVIILGYDIGFIKISDFSGNIRIIQGSKDRYGNIDAVKNDMKKAISKKIEYISVDGADHSYCEPNTKESIYEDEAVKMVFKT